MRTPDGRTFAGNDPLKAENRQRDRNIDVLNRRTQQQPKPAKPVIAGGGPLGSTRLVSTLLSDGGNNLSVMEYRAEDTPTREDAVPDGWAPPRMYYPTTGEPWSSSPVVAEAGWYQVTGYALGYITSGTPAHATASLTTPSGDYYNATPVNYAAGSSPRFAVSVTSLPFYSPGASPDQIYSGDMWVQVDWDAPSVSVAASTVVYLDVVRLA